MATDIIVLGLGPGAWGQLTGEARDILNKVRPDHLYFRTIKHPTVDALPAATRDGAHSFDALYEASPTFEAIYTNIAASLSLAARNAAAGSPIIYAVPGHPLIGEASVLRLLTRAQIADIPVRIVAGLSFIEPLCTALRLDPLAAGLQLVDATQLASELEVTPTQLAASDRKDDGGPQFFSPYSIPFANNRLPTLLTLSPNAPLLVSQLYNSRTAGMVKLALLELYPPDYEVTLVRAAGTAQELVLRLPLHELDHSEHAAAVNHLTCLYLPPMPALASTRQLSSLIYIMARLNGPRGCPWDREQSHQTIKQNLIEETYEAVEALDALAANPNDADALHKFAEELGDILLQVVFHAQLGAISGEFTLAEVVNHIASKLLRRHPHVFGDVQVSGSGEVLQNWEQIKQQERAAAAAKKATRTEAGSEISGGLKGVSRQLPALHYAQEIAGRVARRGFDWPSADGVLDKVREEIAELAAAPDPQNQREEFGDLLFTLAHLANWLKLDAEESLRLANAKFVRRFAATERKVAAAGLRWDDLDLAALDHFWDAVKADERATAAES